MDQLHIKRYREHEDSEASDAALEADENSCFSREMRHHNEEEASLMDQIDELNRALTAANHKYDQALRNKERAMGCDPEQERCRAWSNAQLAREEAYHREDEVADRQAHH